MVSPLVGGLIALGFGVVFIAVDIWTGRNRK